MSHNRRHPIDTDPLGAIRSELIAAARRRLRTRRRRQRLLGMAATMVGLVTVSGAALALTDVSTGVPAIDRYLDAQSELSNQPTPEQPEGHRPLAPGVKPPNPNLEPSPGSVSPPFTVSLNDGRSARAVGYMTQDGTLCAALAEADTTPEPPPGFSGCIGGALLPSALREDMVLTVTAARKGSSTWVQGVTTDDVRSLTLIGPTGQGEASLSDAWTPRGWRADPLRVFFAVVETGPAETDSHTVLATLRFEARLADGTTLTSDP